MNLKRIIWILVALLAVLFIFRISTRMTTGKKITAARVIPVIAVNPKIGMIEESVILTGDIKGEKEVSVRPRTVGRVEEIFVKEGDYVEQGTPLLSFVTGITEKSDIYEDMVVRAPISGIVGIQLVKLGDQVTNSGGSNSAVFTLYGIDKVKVLINVPEKYYARLRNGLVCDISLDAFPNQLFHGRVNNIRPVIDPLTRTTQVEIIQPNPNHKIKPGMFARVNLIISRKSNAMLIPMEAMLSNTEDFVYVVNNGFASKKIIHTGMIQGDNLEVLSGLDLTDKVITTGQKVVKEGDKVSESIND
jgi:membrane fusion protein (multidrug efflux system)